MNKKHKNHCMTLNYIEYLLILLFTMTGCVSISSFTFLVCIPIGITSSTVGLTLICIKWIPGDPSTMFLATSFTQKMPEGSDSMYSYILMLKNI